MTTLILTEKPSVAKDFAKALGVPIKGQGFYESSQYIITWAIGHLLELKSPENYDPKWKRWSLKSLPILPERLSYKANYKTKSQLAIVKAQLRKSEVAKIVVATDAGREGELIARTLLMSVKIKAPIYRFWTSQALSKSVILETLNDLSPASEYDRLYYAGRARQSADWLVGMNLSRLATLKMGDLFSIGRVQTAVLSLLVARKLEIDDFKPEPYFQIRGNFSFSSGSFKALWFDPKVKEEASRIIKKEDALNVIKRCEGKPAVIHDKKETKVSKASPQLFSLTELQRVANRMFGFSAKKTLSIAQDLYEKKKCLSYPRTDARVLGTKAFSQVQGLIEKLKVENPEYFEKFDGQKLTLKNRLVFNDAKLTDHHALIPLKTSVKNLKGDEFKIFDLITKRFIGCFLENYDVQETKLVVSVGNDFYKTKGEVLLNLGWMSLSSKKSKEIELPFVSLKETGETRGLELEDKMTTPPPHYTEASLLYDMTNPARLVSEKELKKVFRTEIGLGTQATRAQIIETLLMRKYIERAGKNLMALEKGVLLIKEMRQFKTSGALTNASETAKWELELSKIAWGEGDPRSFMVNIRAFVTECASEWKEADIEKIPEEKRTRKPKKFLKGTNEVIGTCPLCKSNVIDMYKSYGCEKWKDGCKFTIWKMMAKRSISLVQAKKLISTGQTDIIKGFKSKGGKKFSAKLVYNQDGVSFEFN